MPEQGAPPARYLVPPGDYQPPAGGPRRPGSDHSYLPHSLESSPVTETAARYDAEKPQSFDLSTPEERQQWVVAALKTGGPATSSELATRLDASNRVRLNDAIQSLRRAGTVGGVPVPGSPAKRWHLQDAAPDMAHAGAQTEDEDTGHAESQTSAENASPADQPSSTHVPEPPGVPEEFRRSTPTWPQPREPQPPYCMRLSDGITRAAVDSDGRLILWLDATRCVETDPRTARHILALLRINEPLMAAATESDEE